MPPYISNSTAGALQLVTDWRNTTDVYITAIGHVDLSTAKDFTDYVFRHAGNSQHLTLDMTQVTFFDCAGFAALYDIAERCRTAHVAWNIQPAHCVSRVVTMCDPRNELALWSTAEFDAFCA